MQYYVKEWPDRTATLVAEDGHDLTTFPSLEQAVMACRLWCHVNPQRIEKHTNYLAASPCDFESSYLQRSHYDILSSH